jgi:tetratricopeptide (TPR) repeat protein
MVSFRRGFAQITLMKSRSLSAVARALVAGVCLLGMWESSKILRSDQFYWENTADSTRAAIRLEPDCWWCYMQLAQSDDKDAEQLLRTSLQINPYNSEAAIDLGLRYEADGDFSRAEKLLLQAFAVDQTYAPRWSLANFYFRRDNIPLFWTWARRATEMPAEDMSGLFELCWHISTDPNTIEENIVENDPIVIRQYIDFLVGKDQAKAALHPALRLVHFGSPDRDRERLFFLTDRLIDANEAAGATSLWHELIGQHWVVADTSVPNNPDFSRAPLPVKFDWAFEAYGGLHSWPGSSGLVTEFTGEEPETCTIAEEAISLPPGEYKLESTYHTRDIAANTGIRWQIAESSSDTVFVNSPFLSSDTLAHVALSFSVKPGTQLLRLRLAYNRQLGTPRVTGTLVVPSIRIEAIPST